MTKKHKCETLALLLQNTLPCQTLAKVKQSRSQLTQFLNTMPVDVSVHEPNR